MPDGIHSQWGMKFSPALPEHSRHQMGPAPEPADVIADSSPGQVLAGRAPASLGAVWVTGRSTDEPYPELQEHDSLYFSAI